MFLLNIGYQWGLASIDEVTSGIFLPMGNSSEKLIRGSQPELSRYLIDPQLYLAGIDAARCKKICGRLSSFPWFSVPNAPVFDSGEMTMKKWDAKLKAEVVKNWPGKVPTDEEKISIACYSALSFQVDRGCSHLIFPSPLVTKQDDYGAVQGLWLDYCLEEAEELEVGQPKLATLALDESMLDEDAFAEGGILDTLVDQISSREGVDGVYLLISQKNAEHPFEMSSLVTAAYARLVHSFAQQGYEYVITNFADVFGWALQLIGATGFATGGSQSQRRLSISSLSDEGFGLPLPVLYSHNVLAELLSETDIDKIVNRKLLRYVSDVTTYSEPLFEALNSGATAATVPEWAESKNNVTAAQRHFIARIAHEATKGKSPIKRREFVRASLEAAVANSNYVLKKLGKTPLKGRVAPSEYWLDTLNELS